MTSRRGRRCAWLLGAGAALFIGGAAAIADRAVPEDAKYQKAFDEAVDKALAYLARAQLGDGSFPANMRNNTAIASLGVMAFLARGYSPGLPPYGDTINRGIDFVLSVQAPDGTIIGAGGGQMYSHNISTLMLSEVSGMVDPDRQKRIDQALPKALKVILDAQDVPKAPPFQGGWRYEPKSTDSDISHSGWALMALRSARNNGAPVPKEALDRATKFIMMCAGQEGQFSYQPGGGVGLIRTAVALLCLELSGRHRVAETIVAGGWVAKRFKQEWRAEYPYYALYYCAHGMFQLGGQQWERFAPELYDTILKLQGSDGAWAPLSAKEDESGPCYCTSMAVLALSVSYRQLPIYQR